jgi:hypothetical protein
MNRLDKTTTPTPKDSSRSLVVQSNPLIEARYKLPLLAQQVLRTLISKIKPNTTDIDKEFYQINIAEFGRQIGRSETSALKEEITRVAKILLKVPIFIKTESDFTETRWIQGYHYHNGVGLIDFKFSGFLNPFLTELKRRFTQYRLENIFRLGSQYSIRIYELMIQYASIGSRTIPLDELRIILGVKEGGYENYYNFNRRILSPAHKEVNTKTDLRYSWKPVKEKKWVIAIRFYDIATSEPASAHTATPPAFKPSRPDPALPEEVIDLIPEGHRNDKGLIDTLSFHLRASGQKFVRDALCYANKRELKNYPAYVTVLLRNGFTEEPEPPQTKAPIDLPPEIQKRRWITIDGKEFMISGFIDNLVSLDGKDGAKNSITKSLLAKFLGDGRASLAKNIQE